MATTMKRSRHPSSSDDSDNGRRKPKKSKNVKTQRKIKKGKNERKAQKAKPPASLRKRRTVKDIPTGRKTKKSKPVKTKRKIKNEKKEREERKVKPPVSLVIKRQSRDRRKSWTIKDIPTGNSTCWSQQSQLRRGSGQKPSEVFRTDLITAMKVPDSFQLSAEDFCVLADPWRQEWEKGVQVPVSPQSIPQPVARVLLEKGKEVMFSRPKKLIRTSGCEALGYVDIRTLAEGMCRYDLSHEDVCWLHMANQEFTEMALPPLDEITMERTMEEFERCCHDSMSHAMETEEGLGIEYDEDVVCDVCQSPDGEDNNEMVFCDKCNICVHQACYGIQKVPKGSWLCRICALGITPKCQLCPKKGGAMKPTRSGTKWVHVSCALWIPEVSIGNPEKMEPITNVSQIPSNRWALICCVCKEKTGACIQCSANNCRTAFHVTCGLSASLEMNTLLTDEDEVKFKSFCPKHSGLEGEGEGEGGEEEREREGTAVKKGKRRGRKFCLLSLTNEEEAATSPSSSIATGDIISRQQEKRVNLRKLKVQAIEEDFYRFVEVDDVAGRLKLPRETVDFLYQYWKLKRKANHNQPLLTPKRDEEESLARREQEVLLRRLQLFTHLRQDLERVRNLTYMVTRREKMKRSLWKVQEQVFQHQVKLIDQEMINGDPSAKDLEQLFSLGWLSTQSSHSALKPKRPLKPEKKKNTDRKTFSDSPHTHTQPPPHTHTQTHTHKNYSVCKPSDSKDSKSTRIIIKEATSTQPTSEISEIQREIFPKQEIATETVTVKLHRPEIRKGSSADGRKRNTTNNHEQQDLRRRKKRIIDNMAESSVKNRLASKHLEKTVSIRLVDIRNSEADEYFFDHDGGISKRSHPVSLDVTPPNSKQQQQQHSDATVATTTKANGWLRKPHSNGSHTPNNNTRHVTSAAGHLKHLKGWGKFRIPKRSEKSPTNEDDGDGLLGPLSNTPEQPLSSYPRTRLRTGTESDGYTSDSKSSKDGGETEPCLKRCHSHKLRGDATAMGRRYGSDIIQRGVLAL